MAPGRVDLVSGLHKKPNPGRVHITRPVWVHYSHMDLVTVCQTCLDLRISRSCFVDKISNMSSCSILGSRKPIARPIPSAYSTRATTTSPCPMSRKRQTGLSSSAALWRLRPKKTLSGLQTYQVPVQFGTWTSPGATRLLPLLTRRISPSMSCSATRPSSEASRPMVQTPTTWAQIRWPWTTRDRGESGSSRWGKGVPGAQTGPLSAHHS